MQNTSGAAELKPIPCFERRLTVPVFSTQNARMDWVYMKPDQRIGADFNLTDFVARNVNCIVHFLDITARCSCLSLARSP